MEKRRTSEGFYKQCRNLHLLVSSLAPLSDVALKTAYDITNRPELIPLRPHWTQLTNLYISYWIGSVMYVDSPACRFDLKLF